MVTTEVAAGRRRRATGSCRSTDDGTVTDYAYKPDEPATTTATNEVFVFTPAPTLDRLEALAADAGEDGLEDLGSQLLPAQTRDGLARAYRARGVLAGRRHDPGVLAGAPGLPVAEPPIDLDDPAWPLHTRGGRHSAARILAGAEIDESLISGGTRVAGEVRGSVLSPGVVVEAGRDGRGLGPAARRAGAAGADGDPRRPGRPASRSARAPRSVGTATSPSSAARRRVARDSEVPTGARLPDPRSGRTS